MPSQGHLVCGVQCNIEQEIRDLYASLGVNVQEIEVSDSQNLPPVSFKEAQLDILEQISSYSRTQLENMLEHTSSSGGLKSGKLLWPMFFEPIGNSEIGHIYPNEYIFGVLLTGRYFPTLLDWNQEHGAGDGPCEIKYTHLGIALEHIRKRIPKANIYTMDLFH